MVVYFCNAMNFTILNLIIIISALFIVLILFKLGKKQRKNKATINQGLNSTLSEAVTEDQKSEDRSIFKFIGFITLIPIITTAFILIFSIGGCSSDFKTSIIVLEQNGQKYIYHSSPFLMQNSIDNGKTVDISLYSKINLYSLEESIYVEPHDVKAFAAMATNRFKIVEYDHVSHAGFVIESDSLIYNIETEVIPSQKIGDTKTKQSIIISDGLKDLRIEYILNGVERIALRNCEVKSVWSVSSPYAGKTVGSHVDRLLVNVKDVMHYFNPSVQMELEEDQNILLIQLN